MVAWGICTTLMGLVHNFGGLLVARAALGIAEGGLFPGVTFYITMWYRRHECGLRMVSNITLGWYRQGGCSR
jgi:MFS family permease